MILFLLLSSIIVYHLCKMIEQYDKERFIQKKDFITLILTIITMVINIMVFRDNVSFFERSSNDIINIVYFSLSLTFIYGTVKLVKGRVEKSLRFDKVKK